MDDPDDSSSDWSAKWEEFWEKDRGNSLWQILGGILLLPVGLFLLFLFTVQKTPEGRMWFGIFGSLITLGGIVLLVLGVRGLRRGTKDGQEVAVIPRTYPTWALYGAGICIVLLRFRVGFDWQNLKHAGWIEILLGLVSAALLGYYVLSRIRGSMGRKRT